MDLHGPVPGETWLPSSLLVSVLSACSVVALAASALSRDTTYGCVQSKDYRVLEWRKKERYNANRVFGMKHLVQAPGKTPPSN